MKGLDLAREYYRHVGTQMLQDRFGEFTDRIAAGFAGPGSECFGFDDEISRDHDWGPAFCLWLTAEDYQNHGEDLQKAYQALPQVFMGFGPRSASPGEEFRVGVCPTHTFYNMHTGLDHPPATLREWLTVPEPSLATCTNGEVFNDPLGEFTRWREAILAFYPEDIRLKKIASRCLTIAQSGQYNLARSLRRGERFTAHWALTQFCIDTMSLIFLLNKRFAPFHKWMHRAVRELPLLGQWTHETVFDLVEATELTEMPAKVEQACAVVIRELRSQGLTDSTSDFLLDHAPSVHGRIRDEGLRQRLSVVS